MFYEVKYYKDFISFGKNCGRKALDYIYYFVLLFIFLKKKNPHIFDNVCQPKN